MCNPPDPSDPRLALILWSFGGKLLFMFPNHQKHLERHGFALYRTLQALGTAFPRIQHRGPRQTCPAMVSAAQSGYTTTWPERAGSAILHAPT